MQQSHSVTHRRLPAELWSFLIVSLLFVQKLIFVPITLMGPIQDFFYAHRWVSDVILYMYEKL